MMHSKKLSDNIIVSKSTFVVLILFASITGPNLVAQGSDQMTFKTFSTAKGRVLDIDVSFRDVLWRFENEIEMRFSFDKINFILFGEERCARIYAGKDSLLLEGTLREFAPDRGITLRQRQGTPAARIITDVKKLLLIDSTEIKK